MPEKGTPEYEETETNPEKAFFRTVPTVVETVLVTALIEILSRHSSDEVYLGERDSDEWTVDGDVLKAFVEFGDRLVKIEEGIVKRNSDVGLKNRVGPVKVPYMLLFPRSGGGLTGRGIPNSVSI